MGPDRGLQPNGQAGVDEARLLDLEVDEDGTIHLFCGRGTDTRHGLRCVMPGLVAGLTIRVLRLAAAVSDAASYRGAWTVGLALTNLRGACDARAVERFDVDPASFSEGEYRMVTEVDAAAIADDTDPVLVRLTGRLWRALGTQAPTEASVFGERP